MSKDNDKALVIAQSEAAYYAKVLIRLRDTLLEVCDNLDEEGDRTYFGSTNDADRLKDVSKEIDALAWDEIMHSSQPPVDLYEQIDNLSNDLTNTTAKLAEALAIVPLTATKLADALDCFWNAAIGASHRQQSDIGVASVVAEGVAAVAAQLREE